MNSEGGSVPPLGSLAAEATLLAAAVRDWMADGEARHGHAGRHGPGGDPGGGHGGQAASGAQGGSGGQEPSGDAGDRPSGDAEDRESGGAASCSCGHDGHAGRPVPSSCQACPVCRLIVAITASRPDAAAHLTAAAAALTEVYRAVRDAWLAGAAAPYPRAEPSPPAAPSGTTPTTGPARPRVQRIDVR